MPVRIDASEFLRDLEALRSDIHNEIRIAWEQAADETKELMKENGYNNRTGHLSNTMYSRVYVNGMFNVSAEVVAPANYALWVDKPTKAHWIFPRGVTGSTGKYQHPNLGTESVQRRRNRYGRQKNALRWYENGVPVFRKWVHHPGTYGANFSGAAENNGWRFAELTQEAVDRAILRHD